MCPRFVFLLIMWVISWLRLSHREEARQTAETLILRHQLVVLQRRQPRLCVPKPRPAPPSCPHPLPASGATTRGKRLRDSPAGHDPLHRLAGDLGDKVVVAVVVQQGEAFSFCHGSDEQVGEAYCSHAPAAPERGLDIKRAPPVLIMYGEPLVAGIAVDSQLVELCAAPGGPSYFELKDTAGGYPSRLDQRGKHRGDRRVAQAGQRASVRQVSGYRRHAARITSSSSRSGRPPEASLRRSRRRAARAVTSRRAALTVSFLVAVCSTCWAAARYSSLTSIRVFATFASFPTVYLNACSLDIPG